MLFKEDITIVDFNAQLKNSSGRWSHHIFQTRSYSEPEINKFNSIHEKYEYLIEVFQNNGANKIYVRDCSFSGFNTYQIVIPGFSEAFLFNEQRKNVRPMPLLESLDNISRLSEKEVSRFISDLEIRVDFEFSDEINIIDNYYINLKNSTISCLSWQYVLFLLYINQRQYDTALWWLEKHMELVESSNALKYFNNLFNAVVMHKNGFSLNEIYSTINLLSEETVSEFIEIAFENPFSTIYSSEAWSSTEVYRKQVELYHKLKELQLSTGDDKYDDA